MRFHPLFLVCKLVCKGVFFAQFRLNKTDNVSLFPHKEKTPLAQLNKGETGDTNEKRTFGRMSFLVETGGLEPSVGTLYRLIS